MENVIRMLRLKLRNERIFRADALMALKAMDQSVAKSVNMDDYKAYQESHDNADRIIPQLEQAIKILTEWKGK